MKNPKVIKKTSTKKVTKKAKLVTKKPLKKKIDKTLNKYLKDMQNALNKEALAVLDPNAITKELDVIFKKYNIRKGLCILEYNIDASKYNTLSIAHEIKSTKKKEMAFAQAGLNLFEAIGFDTESISTVTEILNYLKQTSQFVKSSTDDKIIKAENQLSKDQLKELQIVRDEKNKYAKLQNWEKAAEFRSKELEILNLN